MDREYSDEARAAALELRTRLERDIAADEQTLHDPDLYAKDPTRFAALTEAIDAKRAAKDAAELRWLTVAEMAEGLSP